MQNKECHWCNNLLPELPVTWEGEEDVEVPEVGMVARHFQYEYCSEGCKHDHKDSKKEVAMDIDEMFDKGIVPQFERPLAEEEKSKFVRDTLLSIAKPFMFTFYMLDLKTHIEGDIVNGANGDRFKVKFEKVS